MRRHSISRLIVLLGLIIFFGLRPPLWAHAIIIDSIPGLNTTVPGPDVQIVLKFNSRIDGSRSRLSLVLPDKSTRSITLDKQDSPDQLKAKATALEGGSYILRWQVLAADGHITRGEIPFKVK